MTQGNNKVAIITGASRGIGAAIAQRLAHNGFTVVINYAGKASEAEALTAKIEKDGGRAIGVQADVSDHAAVSRMFDRPEAAFGAVDVHILSKELRGRNITVNAVAPGPTATGLFLDGKPQELIDQLSKRAPLERLGQPEDIANAVAFFAGPDGAWINGQILRANGGVI